MPRISDKRGQPASFVSVSPWMTKKPRSGNPAAPTATPSMYSVAVCPMALSTLPHKPHDDHPQQFFRSNSQTSASRQAQNGSSSTVWHKTRRTAKIALYPSQCSMDSGRVPVAAQAAKTAPEAAALTNHAVVMSRHTGSGDSQTCTAANGMQAKCHYQQQPAAMAAAAGAVDCTFSTAFAVPAAPQLMDLHHHQQQLQVLQQQQQKPQQQQAAMALQQALDNVQAAIAAFEQNDCTKHEQRHGQQQKQPALVTLRGVANLVLHPTGAVSGHFVGMPAIHSAGSNGSNSRTLGQPRCICLGLQGSQVLGIHSCYRDPEWALLQMNVIRYNSNNNSGITAALCKGGTNGCGSSSSQSGSTGDTAATIGQLASKHDPTHECTASSLSGSAAQTNAATMALLQERQQLVPVQQQGDLQMQLCRQQQQQQQGPHAQSKEQQQHEQQQAAGSQQAPSQQVSTYIAAAAVPADGLAQTAAQDILANTAADTPDAEAVAAAWVQRTGGDLVNLQPADLDDDDTYAAIVADNLGMEPDFVHVHFTPHTLLVGAAADKHLVGAWQHLVGEGVAVNLGDMAISNLPAGFL